MSDAAADAAVTAALEAIERAWAGRSPSEQAGFRRRIAHREPAQPLTADTALTVRRRAALSGEVSPRHLVRGLPADEAEQALDLLGPDFDRSCVGGEWKWTLRSQIRQDTLHTLTEAGLPDALADARAIPTDEAGKRLRELCSGHVLSLTDRPDVAMQALAWAAPFGRHHGALAEARRLSRIRSLVDSYRVLIESGFVGRAELLARLEEFCGAPAGGEEGVPVLVLTGVGGAGKSTVLARYVTPLLERLEEPPDDGPLPVLVDFDRLLFRLDVELELSFEVTRQLGMAHRDAWADFSALRHQAREERRSTSSDAYSDQHSAEHGAREALRFEQDAGVVVRMHRLDTRPVVLVLDTFEEWQRDGRDPDHAPAAGGEPEERLVAWLDRLRTVMGLRGIRVVLSGRADLHALPAFAGAVVQHVGDLPCHEAVELLALQGIDAGHGERLARMVGGNPLTLRVAARFFGNLDSDAAEAFLSDDVPHGALAEELRRAVLYDRYLDHITDPLVRRLAHPGLVLRRLTPAVVRDVLAPACRLGDLDEASTRRLVRHLAREVWLVKETPDGLRHQPDIRREMLRHMVGDSRHRYTIRSIHRAATEWYRSSRADLPRDRAEVEALYHELMLGPSPDRLADLSADRAGRRNLAALGETVTDFTPEVAVQVRLARGEHLAHADAISLPTALWEEWLAVRGEELVSTGRAPLAAELFERRPAHEEPGWLAQACCDSARWSLYDRAVHDVHLRLWAGRHAVVNAIVTGSDSTGACLRWVSQNIGHLQVRSGDPEEIVEQLYYTLLLATQLDEPWPDRALAQRVMFGRARNAKARTDRYPVDQLRRVICWAAADAPGPPMKVGRLADVFRPDEAWLRDVRELPGVPWFPVPRFDRETANRILSDVARGFAVQVGSLTLERDVLIQPHVLKLFRGDNPELRPAIRLALRSIGGDRSLADLASIAAGVLGASPLDLRPERMPPAGAPEAEAARTLLTEYVDRAGRTGPFLTAVFRRWPDVPLVREVHRAFNRWDAVHMRLIDATAARRAR